MTVIDITCTFEVLTVSTFERSKHLMDMTDVEAALQNTSGPQPGVTTSARPLFEPATLSLTLKIVRYSHGARISVQRNDIITRTGMREREREGKRNDVTTFTRIQSVTGRCHLKPVIES